MPLPLAPVTAMALKYGTVALAGYTLARQIERGRRCQHAEDAMDRVDEGVTLRREGQQTNFTARLRRVFRLGQDGPGVEIDASAFGRVKFRKI